MCGKQVVVDVVIGVRREMCVVNRSSSPVLRRFSKQLKQLNLSDSDDDDDLTATSVSVSRSTGALTGPGSTGVSTSSVETCQEHEQYSITSQQTLSCQPSYTCQLENNLPSSICLSTSDEMMRSEAGDAMMSHSGQFSECSVSSSFSVTEQRLRSSFITGRSCSMPVAIVSGDEKADWFKQGWSAGGTHMPLTDSPRSNTDGLESTLSHPNAAKGSFHESCRKSEPVYVGVSDVARFSTQLGSCSVPLLGDSDITAHCDTCSADCCSQPTMDVGLYKTDVVVEDKEEAACRNSAAKSDVVPMNSRCDSISGNIDIKVSKSDTNTPKLSTSPVGVSGIDEVTTSCSQAESVETVNSEASCAIVPVDIATEGSELYYSDQGNMSPSCVETVDSSLDEDGSVSDSGGCPVSTLGNFNSDGVQTPHCYSSSCPSDGSHTQQTSFPSGVVSMVSTTCLSCSVTTGTVPSTCQLPLTTVNSCSVPVSVFSAQPGITPMPVPTESSYTCSTLERNQVIIHDDGLHSVNAEYSAVSKVSVSEGGIPHKTVQCNPSELPLIDGEDIEKSESGANKSCVPSQTAWSSPASDVLPNTSCMSTSDILGQSSSMSGSVLPATDHLTSEIWQHCSTIISDGSSDNVPDSQQCPVTNILETDSYIEERKGCDDSNGDVSVSRHSISDSLRISDTDTDVLDCQRREQKVATDGDEPDECISDEVIVSQILAADCCQSESVDRVFLPQSSASSCFERQKWREMVSPVISSQQLSDILEGNSSKLSSLTMDGANSSFLLDDESVSDLIHSVELSHNHHDHEDLGLLPAVVPSNEDWMYDGRQLQDVLCSLLNSCHVTSTDPDDSLPAAGDEDDDTQSCSSSATEVYDDLPEDLKLDDVTHDKDSDGTVSLLSVMLDEDGLDLMDSTSDGFQKIYSSLVDQTAVDRILTSETKDLSNGTCCSTMGATDLSAFGVECGGESLLDKERSSALMALDVELVKNLPCRTSCLASLCDRLDNTDQVSSKGEDSLCADNGEKSSTKSVNCQCSQSHTSKKSCRSSLRMPEKLADIDPSSPSLTCRPPPLSVHCRKYDSGTSHTSDVALASSLSPGLLDGETANDAYGSRKRKCRSDAMNKTDTKSPDKDAVKISSTCELQTRRGSKHKNDRLKDRVASKNWESCRLRSRNVTVANEAARDLSATCKRKTWSQEVRSTRIVHVDDENRQTTFTVEHPRTGSLRTIILRRTVVPPVLGTGKKSKNSKRKRDQFKGHEQLNCSQSQSNARQSGQEKSPSKTVEKQTTGDDDEEGRRTDIREVKAKIGKIRLKRKTVRNGEKSAEFCSVVRHSTRGSGLSQENGSMAGKGTAQSGSCGDIVSGSKVCQGAERKRCSLLAQLSNSEGYVAERSVSRSQQPLDGSLLWSDSRRLSREERALQVSPNAV